ncbi:MAG: hypothetical protein LBS56_01285 [Propionibacteriaceae bacterium]|jgi:hypothetical protein|nr:hypothetical protein [Propionibacteriaceae bacterium]
MSRSDDLLRNLSARSVSSRRGGDQEEVPSAKVAACPGCGAPCSRKTGLTTCAYCGHAFLDVAVTDGLFIGPSDNS